MYLDKDDVKVLTEFPKGTSFHISQKGNLEQASNNNSESEDEAQPAATSMRKTLIGLVIVLLIAISWVGAQQFAQSANTIGNFSAPFFTTWFSTCWMTLCYPVYCLFIIVVPGALSFNDSIQQSLLIFGPTKVTIKQTLTIILPFNVLWIATNYFYIYALTYIAATDASAISASNVAFVYFFSFFVLREQIFFIQIVASCFCISGVVLFAYADGFSENSNTATGIILAIISAVGAAIYKVLFKKVVGDASLGQVSLYLSLLGTTNAIFLWIIFLILYFTGLEQMTADNIPWDYLCGSSALGLLFNFLVDYGIAFTYPLFISVAMMLGIPLNAVVDLLFRGVLFSAIRLVAALLVVLGFGLIMCPDTWNLPFHRLCACRWNRCYNGPPSEEDETPFAYSGGAQKPSAHQVSSVDSK